MSRRRLVLAAVAALVILLGTGLLLRGCLRGGRGASAEHHTAVPVAPEPGVPRVYVGVYLRDVTKLDLPDATFAVDAEVWAKWRGELDIGDLSVANASSDATFEKVQEQSDGDWHVQSWRLRGPLRAEFPLHDYPFDRQVLSIDFELRTHAGALEPDLAASSIAQQFSVTGWDYVPRFSVSLHEHRFPSDLGRLDAEGHDTKVRQLSFRLPVSRPSLMAALKLFLPLVVILLVAIIVFWVHPEEFEARAGIGVTALLTCFAFQFTVGDTLPQVSYLTLTDRYFLGTYAVCVTALALSVLAAYWTRAELARRARALDRIARIAFPVGIVIAALVGSGRRTAAPPSGPPPQVDLGAGHRSARAVLRVVNGTLTGGLATSPVPRLIIGGLTLDQGEADPLPLYVEQLPGVTTSGLDLLPDGALEVRWTLRPGMRWSDGAPLEPEDLCFGEQLIARPHAMGCTVIGRRTVALRFDDRVVEALESPTAVPRHEAKRRSLMTAEALREYRKVTPLPGLGAYRVRTFEPGSKIVLERNPYYPGSPANIEVVEITAADASTVIRLIERRELDLTVPNTVKPEGYLALVGASIPGLQRRLGEALLELFPDYSVPVLATVEGRRAVSQALDRQRYVDGPYHGLARATDALIASPEPAPTRDGAALAAIAAAHPEWATARLPVYAAPADPGVAAAIVEDLRAAGFTGAIFEPADDLMALRKTRHGGLVVMPHAWGPRANVLVAFNLPTVASGSYDRAARHPGFTDEIAELDATMSRSLYRERREQLRHRIEAAHASTLATIPLLFLHERMYVDPALRGWDTPGVFGAALPLAYFGD